MSNEMRDWQADEIAGLKALIIKLEKELNAKAEWNMRYFDQLAELREAAREGE